MMIHLPIKLFLLGTMASPVFNQPEAKVKTEALEQNQQTITELLSDLVKQVEDMKKLSAKEDAADSPKSNAEELLLSPSRGTSPPKVSDSCHFSYSHDLYSYIRDLEKLDKENEIVDWMELAQNSSCPQLFKSDFNTNLIANLALSLTVAMSSAQACSSSSTAGISSCVASLPTDQWLMFQTNMLRVVPLCCHLSPPSRNWTMTKEKLQGNLNQLKQKISHLYGRYKSWTSYYCQRNVAIEFLLSQAFLIPTCYSVYFDYYQYFSYIFLFILAAYIGRSSDDLSPVLSVAALVILETSYFYFCKEFAFSVFVYHLVVLLTRYQIVSSFVFSSPLLFKLVDVGIWSAGFLVWLFRKLVVAMKLRARWNSHRQLVAQRGLYPVDEEERLPMSTTIRRRTRRQQLLDNY